MADVRLTEENGVRIAVEGCGHGTLNAIYASIDNALVTRGWPSIELLIICGDFQATRNANDLTCMSVPAKYRALGDFHDYYSGVRQAPYLTIFVGGNHEAASYLWELYYGGWVAPNIYYMGAANVLRFGPLRIMGMSGIWKGFDYGKTHHERLPFNDDDVKSFYHVREIDVRKLLQIREPVDVGISHDWPRAIEKHGDTSQLWRMKPDFKDESEAGTLGNEAARYVMDRLRPPYWFSAHLHCKYSAMREYRVDEGKVPDGAPNEEGQEAQRDGVAAIAAAQSTNGSTLKSASTTANPDEIDLDIEDDQVTTKDDSNGTTALVEQVAKPEESEELDDLRSQLPASFAKPGKPSRQSRTRPGQPIPDSITNRTVRFLALDKCLSKRKFLQLVPVVPLDSTQLTDTWAASNTQPFKLQYDPEWLAITRVFAKDLVIGDREAKTSEDLGEAHYEPLIREARKWVNEQVVDAGKLDVPENFVITAPPQPEGRAELHHLEQPDEYTNPQTTAFCELVGVPNVWDATDEERQRRRQAGPAARQFSGGHRGRGRDRGRGRGRGGFGRARGRGRY